MSPTCTYYSIDQKPIVHTTFGNLNHSNHGMFIVLKKDKLIFDNDDSNYKIEYQ